MTREQLLAVYRERVARGVALLDAKAPGWREKVQEAGGLSGSDMQSMHGAIGACGCVLGRTFGNIYDGMHALGLRIGYDGAFDVFEDAIHHGFAIGFATRRSVAIDLAGNRCASDDPQVIAAWDALAECWREVVWPREKGWTT